MKRYAFTIPTDAASGRLLPLVKRMLPELSDRAIRDAFAKRDVKQNGIRTDSAAPLIPGAEVCLYSPEEAHQAPALIRYRDEDLLVAFKPRGVSCERDPKGGKTLTELVWEELRRDDPLATEPLLCHRLDNQTDGLILLCRNQMTQQAMEAAFRERRVRKRYQCLVKGTPQPARRTVKAWLQKNAASATVRVLDREAPGALTILTEYHVLEAGECARVEVWPHTGRTHQIRAQMACLGHPLLGDDKYGDRAFNKRMKAKRLMLCAVSLSFEMDGKWAYLNPMTFSIDPTF